MEGPRGSPLTPVASPQISFVEEDATAGAEASPVKQNRTQQYAPIRRKRKADHGILITPPRRIHKKIDSVNTASTGTRKRPTPGLLAFSTRNVENSDAHVDTFTQVDSPPKDSIYDSVDDTLDAIAPDDDATPASSNNAEAPAPEVLANLSRNVQHFTPSYWPDNEHDPFAYGMSLEPFNGSFKLPTSDKEKAEEIINKILAVSSRLLKRQRVLVHDYDTFDSRTYRPVGRLDEGTRALRQFTSTLRTGLDDMEKCIGQLADLWVPLALFQSFVSMLT